MNVIDSVPGESETGGIGGAVTSLARPINAILTPILLARGFTIVKTVLTEQGLVDDAILTRWRDGASFKRDADGMGNLILIGRTKFGKELALNIARHRVGGQAEWLHPTPTSLGDLRYSNQQQLEAVVRRVAEAFESEIFGWLGA